jgi:hypothetical protein
MRKIRWTRENTNQEDKNRKPMVMKLPFLCPKRKNCKNRIDRSQIRPVPFVPPVKLRNKNRRVFKSNKYARGKYVIFCFPEDDKMFRQD